MVTKIGTDAVKEVNKFLDKVKPDLVFNRVPKKTLERFKQLANSDEFAGDYGFTLKFLFDFYNGIITPQSQENAEKIEVLAKKLEERGSPEQETIFAVDGKTPLRKEKK